MTSIRELKKDNTKLRATLDVQQLKIIQLDIIITRLKIIKGRYPDMTKQEAQMLLTEFEKEFGIKIF